MIRHTYRCSHIYQYPLLSRIVPLRSVYLPRKPVSDLKNFKINSFIARYTSQTSKNDTTRPLEPSITAPNVQSESLDARIPDLSKILKPITPNDSFVSCSIFDISGNVVAVSRKFPKTKFLSENGLFPRDLRKIDSSAIDIIPTVAVRNNCILVNLLHIKAIVKSDLVMIFDTSASTNAHRLSLFMYDLELKLKQSSSSHGTPYEFKALESILVNVMTCLETELQLHLKACSGILEELEDQIDRDKLRELLVKSKSLTAFYQKALLIRNVLDELLESDDDLEQMYLTERHNKPDFKRDDFAEIEMILEAYYKQCDEFVQNAETLLNDIKSTEEIVNIILDANRNSLMLFELKITVYTLGFTVATAIPLFYGMNLKNYIEESNLGFGAVVGFSVIAAILVTWINFNKLKSVQRITMMLPGAELRKSGLVLEHGDLAKREISKAAKLGNRSNHIYTGVHPLDKNELILSRKKNWIRALQRRRKFNDPKNRDMIWKWLIEEKK